MLRLHDLVAIRARIRVARRHRTPRDNLALIPVHRCGGGAGPRDWVVRLYHWPRWGAIVELPSRRGGILCDGESIQRRESDHA